MLQVPLLTVLRRSDVVFFLDRIVVVGRRKRTGAITNIGAMIGTIDRVLVTLSFTFQDVYSTSGEPLTYIRDELIPCIDDKMLHHDEKFPKIPATALLSHVMSSPLSPPPLPVSLFDIIKITVADDVVRVVVETYRIRPLDMSTDQSILPNIIFVFNRNDNIVVASFPVLVHGSKHHFKTTCGDDDGIIIVFLDDAPVSPSFGTGTNMVLE